MPPKKTKKAKAPPKKKATKKKGGFLNKAYRIGKTVAGVGASVLGTLIAAEQLDREFNQGAGKNALVNKLITKGVIKGPTFDAMDEDPFSHDAYMEDQLYSQYERPPMKDASVQATPKTKSSGTKTTSTPTKTTGTATGKNTRSAGTSTGRASQSAGTDGKPTKDVSKEARVKLPPPERMQVVGKEPDVSRKRNRAGADQAPPAKHQQVLLGYEKSLKRKRDPGFSGLFDSGNSAQPKKVFRA